MSLSCDFCTKLQKLCVISDKSTKYSKYVYLKKLYFFSQSLLSFCSDMTKFLKAHEKIEYKKEEVKKKYYYFLKVFL